jgi:hypothetical protein
MFCEWCSYDFSEISDEFTGYSILKDVDNFIPGKYCSINCCVAQINTSGVDTIIRKQLLYSHYKLHIDVEPAPSPLKLIKKGGNMSYYQYRYNFVCPGAIQSCNPVSAENSYSCSEEYEEEEEEDYDSY